MGKYIFLLFISVIAILVGIFAFLQQPIGNQKLFEVITLTFIALTVFSVITYLVFVKIVKPPISTGWFPLIIIVIGSPLIYISFFNQHGRFYNTQQNLSQSSKIEELYNQAAQHHAGFLFLFPEDEVDPHALKKLESIKPINQKRAKQKEKAIKQVKKLKHNIEEKNKHKNNPFRF